MAASLYALVDRGTLTEIRRKTYTDPVLVDRPDKPKWVPVVRDAPPSYDPDTERLDKSVAVSLTEVRESFSAVALTQPELDQVSTGKILERSLDHAFVTIKLVDALLAKGTIQATDFDATTRQEYLDLKALVDTLRP